MEDPKIEATYASSGDGRMACPFNGNACTDRCPLLLFDEDLEGVCAIAAIAVNGSDAEARQTRKLYRTPMKPR